MYDEYTIYDVLKFILLAFVMAVITGTAIVLATLHPFLSLLCLIVAFMAPICSALSVLAALLCLYDVVRRKLMGW